MLSTSTSPEFTEKIVYALPAKMVTIKTSCNTSDLIFTLRIVERFPLLLTIHYFGLSQ